jgi:hypothetical protein
VATKKAAMLMLPAQTDVDKKEEKNEASYKIHEKAIKPTARLFTIFC